MDKQQIAQILDELAILSELNDENPFKARAYAKAARVVSGMTEDIDKLVEDGNLTSIDGIGEKISEKITELVKTGKLKSYESLRASIPDGVLQMLKIPGLGPKKVRYMWKERGIQAIAELELICRRHRLADAPGFGRKTEEKILQGIESLRRFAGKWLLSDALAVALKIHSLVEGWPEVNRSEIAGSVRRRKELVKDIDILVATDRPKKVMERFATLPGIERVILHGDTKSEIIMKSSIQCDLRAVSKDQYPFALYYFTGSKDHNVKMRAIAKARGMKLSEYGLFKGKSEKSVRCKDEAAIFKALGMKFIEPELREDMGEIEAASKNRLPRPVEMSDVIGLIHAHSTYTDGAASIDALAEKSHSMGFKYLAVCDHSQAVTVAGGMKPADVKRQHIEIDKLNKRLKGFRVLKGIEVDILPDGSLDYDDRLLATFDIVIASVHLRFNMGEDEMTSRIIKGMSNPYAQILAHPTGRLLLAREPYKVDLRRVIDAVGDMGKAIEINAHPQRLDLDWRWCKYAKERGVKFTIGPDAHLLEGLEYIIFGIWTARKGWLEKGDILNCLSAEKLVGYLKKRKG